MSRGSKTSTRRLDSGLVEVKSKFDAEFRRFSVSRTPGTFDDFYGLIEGLHHLRNIPFLVCYTDPEGDLLPINNNDNYARAITTAKPALRLQIQRKGDSILEISGYGTVTRRKGPISKIIASEPKTASRRVPISMPGDFRRVSAIIDVDIVPESHRRVKLMKNGSDKPLGFYIRDGTSVRVTPHGLEKVPGIFISRLVPGGLAESTGLLAVNDEVLEVNGIEVSGKTLDQVTDMMVANSSNLIITVKPVNQRNNLSPARGSSYRGSQKSMGSLQSGAASMASSYDSDEVKELVHEEDEDEVRNHLSGSNANIARAHSPSPSSSDDFVVIPPDTEESRVAAEGAEIEQHSPSIVNL